MRKLAVGFGCAWVLWSAPATDGTVAPGASPWTIVAKVGGREECVAVRTSKTRVPDAARAQFVCLPEGEVPTPR